MNQPPKIVSKYFSSSNLHNFDDAMACFTPDATVHDTGENLRMEGVSEIRRWLEETHEKYKTQTKILEVSGDGDEIEILTEVSGSFDGSPAKFRYDIRLKNGAIAFLSTAYVED